MIAARRLGSIAVAAGTTASRCDGRDSDDKWLAAAAVGGGLACYYAWRNRVQSRAVIVDCGSGSTRATVFETRNGETFSRGRTIPVALSDALGGDEALLDSFVSSLPSRVQFLGATAGVRNKKQDLSPLSRCGGKLSRSAELRVLTPGEEARWELRAARACAGSDSVGLLSGGGSSLQFGDDTYLASVPLDTYSGRDAIYKRGRRIGSVMHEWECRRRHVNATNEKFYRGKFVAIELAAKTLRRVTDATEIDRDTALRGLEALIKNEENVDMVVYAIHLKVVLELAFGPEATFVLLPIQDQLKPTWPLGLYLERYAM